MSTAAGGWIENRENFCRHAWSMAGMTARERREWNRLVVPDSFSD
jgi:hypothetical protein